MEPNLDVILTLDAG